MIDLRARNLAKLTVRYSVKVKPNENVIVAGSEEALPFIRELYKEIILQKGHPIIRVNLSGVSDFFYKHATKEQLANFPEHWFNTIKQTQKYIGIHTESNTRELSSINPEKISERQKVIGPIRYYINNERTKINRVLVAYPCMAHAQEAEMSENEWENFVYKACLTDWNKLAKKLDKINSKFKSGKKVHLIGENVDLTFLIHGNKSAVDHGEENMPGGEIFMAPVRESLNGWIKFEYPAIESGKEVTGIYLKFEKGKVTEYKADKNQELLKAMLETDKNSSFVGEFGIGCNPNVDRFTKNLLFDEKIYGTIHLALGMAYKENGGGNDSAIHWDIVKDMRKAKIILDGKVIQEKGKWKI